LSGDRQRAIAELEGLRRDKPRFKVPWLVLGEFYLDDGQPERALEVAEQTASELKHDPAPHALAAKVLRRLGRAEEAQAAIDRALEIDPDAGDAHALAAALALDRGDVPQARESIEKAHELAPGDAFVLVTEAEVALAAEPLETARAAVEKALAAAEANPFALLDFQTSALRDRLAQREGVGEGPPCDAD
jgi:tetratricopeptide (TPR) repeat protein